MTRCIKEGEENTQKMNCWTKVEKQMDRKILHFKFVTEYKQEGFGWIQNYKAQLVVCRMRKQKMMKKVSFPYPIFL